MGQFPGFQQTAAPQMMRSIPPMVNGASRGFGGFGGIPGFLSNSGFGGGAPGFFGASGPGFGSQALGAAGAAAKSGGAGWLGHMQTALKAMQSAAPMMQQYGPMLKNLPAMINMMKIMNEPDDDEGDDVDTESGSRESVSLDWESSSRMESIKKDKKRGQGASQPKLFF